MVTFSSLINQPTIFFSCFLNLSSSSSSLLILLFLSIHGFLFKVLLFMYPQERPKQKNKHHSKSHIIYMHLCSFTIPNTIISSHFINKPETSTLQLTMIAKNHYPERNFEMLENLQLNFTFNAKVKTHPIQFSLEIPKVLQL